MSNEQHENSIGSGLNVIVGTVVQYSRYDMGAEGKGGAVWLVGDSIDSEDDKDKIGQQVIKLTIAYDMFDQQKSKMESGDYNLPCLMEVAYKTVQGAKNTLKQKVVSVRPLQVKKSPNASESKPENQNDTSVKDNKTGTTGTVVNK